MARPEGPHRVQVLDLAPGPEGVVRGAPHRHVGVDPHRALLHLPVRGARGHQDGSELGGVGPGLSRRPHVRAAHDLDQGDPGPVVVDEGVVGPVDPARCPGVGGLAGVFFHVGPLDPDHGPVGQLEVAVHVDGLVVLADLVVLGLIGIEVVLPVEGGRQDLAAQGGADGHGQLHGPLVDDRQRAGQTQTDRAHVGVGLVTEHVGAAAEQLGGRLQLTVDLEAHHHLPSRLHARAP